MSSPDAFSAISSSINTYVTPAYLAERKTIFLLISLSIFSRLDSIFYSVFCNYYTHLFTLFHMRGECKKSAAKVLDGCHFWQQRYSSFDATHSRAVMARPAEKKYHCLPCLQYSQHPDVSCSLAHLFESG